MDYLYFKTTKLMNRKKNNKLVKTVGIVILYLFIAYLIYHFKN